MKATFLYLLLFFTVFSSCNSQEIKHKKNTKSKNAPHENITVNRKYDKNGNLIEFDSTYTSYYSNLKGDTLMLDSLLDGFPSFFNEEFFNSNSKNLFNYYFDEDSVLNSHFFNDNYFEQQFYNQNQSMLNMMQKMDSIKNAFFEQQWKTQ